MSNLNKLKFDNYPLHSYFKTNEKAEKAFPSIVKFPDALGFDRKSKGFIVLHRNHQESGIEQEIPACLILKNFGYDIELIEESDSALSADAKISEFIFEIKRLSNATDLLNGILLHFRRAYKKAQYLILHIDKRVDTSNLRRSIRKASEKYPDIKLVLLVYGKKVVELNKEMMKKGDYSI
jgi:hypothetical protein